MVDTFAAHTNISWHGNVGTVEYGGGDKTMLVFFFNKAMHNPAKSTEEGRPWYDERVFVRIHPPGERLNIVERPATEQDKRRWPVQWAQFRENKQQVPEGTPIDLLYPDQPAIAATLRANNVYTVEQCAELSGTAIDSIGMGCQRYVNDSKKYLEAAHKGVGASQLRKELEERDRQIHTLTRQVEMLTGEVRRLTDLNTTGVDLKALQALVAGQQIRPQFPAAQPGQVFDAQSAQINATHATGDIAKNKNRRKRIQT